MDLVLPNSAIRKTIDGKFDSLHAHAMQPNMFLEGNFAPIDQELTLTNLKDFILRGKIPKDLHGTFYRTGPNPQFQPTGNYHWFFGDGMVHAFQISRGEIVYRNRYVRTPTFAIEQSAKRSLFLGSGSNFLANLQLIGGNIFALVAGLIRRGNADVFTKLISKANTSVVPFRDQLLALVESSPPVVLNPSSLDTEGFEDFGESFISPFTAHPKMDALTGYLYAFGYRVAGQPKLEYYVINPSGKIVSRTPIDIPYYAMVHDFVTTRNFAVLPIFPAVASLAAMKKGRIAEWQPDKGAFVYVLAKDGNAQTLKRFEFPPGYAYHYANAYEEGKTIVIDAVFYEKVPLMGSDAECRDELFAGKNPGLLTRFRLNMSNGKVEKTVLDESQQLEFPVIDNRLTGENYDRLFAATLSLSATGAGVFGGHAAYQLSRGKIRAETTHLPEGHFGGEPVFVPTGKPGSPKGYILNLVYNSREENSYLAIYDAEKADKKPVCEIGVLHRIPYGFHGVWRPQRS